MLTTDAITSYLAHLRVNALSDNTIKAYGQDLRFAHAAVGDQPDWPSCAVALAGYLTENRNTWAPKTVMRRLTTFRSWAKWAGGPGNFLANYRAPKPAPHEPHPIPEGIDGVYAMIESTQNPRHRALCVLTGLMGLRIDEAVNVRPEHFKISQRGGDETVELVVRGKGDKTRKVPVSEYAWPLLERAIRVAVRDNTTLVPLTNRGARKAVHRHGRNALGHNVPSHDMRTTFATEAYDRTKDLRAVQELLGHADPKTTQGYTRVSERTKRAAVESLTRSS